MLVNFALNCLNTEVTCDKVSSDGHEPANLLVLDSRWVQKGFLAESFVKPPVTLTFKFPCPVHLKGIILDPKVGSQRSSFIEIYTATQPRKQNLGGTSFQQNNRLCQGDDGRESRSATNNVSQLELEPIFKRIGSIRCSEAGRICFHNPRFCDNTSSTVDSAMESCPLRAELRHHQPVMLLAVDFLAVRIVGTVNGSVPAVGKVYIWGQPARSCPPPLRESILKRFAAAMGSETQQSGRLSNPTSVQSTARKDDAFCKPQSTHPHTEDTYDYEQYKISSGPQDKHSSTALDPSVSIPEDFLDTLTFEIMSLPMLLPCGQSIDMSTLDRCSDCEANYGRPPSDPFTGLGFTAARKPVVNMPLKLRIDRFLLKNADEPSLQSVPRAVGSIMQSSQTVVSGKEKTGPSRLIASRYGCMVGSQKRKMGGGLQQSGMQVDMHEQSGYLPSTGSDMSSAVSFFSVPKKIKIENHTTGKTSTVSSSVSGPVVNSCAASSNNDTHEDRLRSSLSSSLSSVLRGLPAFSSPSGVSSPSSKRSLESANHHCMACGTMLKRGDDGDYSLPYAQVSYVLPCEHMMCRPCLLEDSVGVSVNDVTCRACGKQFARTDVMRSHAWS